MVLGASSTGPCGLTSWEERRVAGLRGIIATHERQSFKVRTEEIRDDDFENQQCRGTEGNL